MKRAEYLAAHMISREKPWEAEGISERTWWRRRKAEKKRGRSPDGISGTTPFGTSPYGENQSINKRLTESVRVLDKAAKRVDRKVLNPFDLDERYVIVVKSTRTGIILTMKLRYKNCKDFDKVRLKDNPNFTVTKTYSFNWKRRKKNDNDNGLNPLDWEEEIRDFNTRKTASA